MFFLFLSIAIIAPNAIIIMAASTAAVIIVIDMGMAIGASCKEVIVSHIEYRTSVVAPAPTPVFACGGATVLYLVSIFASTNAFKFV